MNVYLLLKDQFINRIPPNSVILKSSQSNLDLKFADLGIQLDELIYLNKQPVETVFVVKGNEVLKFYYGCHPDTVHFLSNMAYGSFYCKPEVISILSSLYKYNINFLEKGNEFFQDYFGEHLSADEIHTNKMLHIIDRTGLTIHVN